MNAKAKIFQYLFQLFFDRFSLAHLLSLGVNGPLKIILRKVRRFNQSGQVEHRKTQITGIWKFQEFSKFSER